MAVLLEVESSVLRWAREIRGLSLPDAALKLRIPVDDLKDYESEKSARTPTLSVLRRMAATYHVQFAALFMPTPPPPLELPSEYRTVDGGAPALSEASVDAVREVRDLLEEIAEVEELERLLPASSIPNIDMDRPRESARELRTRSDITAADQLGWRNANDALQHWRAYVESLGILVIAKNIPRADCRGFSIIEANRASIVINSDEVPEAQIFTLFHELGHVLSRTSAICLINFRSRQRVETVCNRFAAGFLMPREVVQEAATRAGRHLDQIEEWDVRDLAVVAGRLKISRPALALRLVELGLPARQLYLGAIAAWSAESWKERKPKSKGDRGGIPVHIRVVHEYGLRFTSGVISAADHSHISRREASDLLRAPARAFQDISSYALKRRGDLGLS